MTRPTLLLVTGSGRSGTSTAAGALKRLGFRIPQPEIPPDESNPRGFYEPQWVVEFHKELLNSIPARTNDARPRIAAHTEELAADPEVRDRLITWLREQMDGAAPGAHLAIKDPRAFWFHGLWKAAAATVGADLAFLTMLRHPAEVAQSRDTHYLQQRTLEFRRTRQTANIAGWVNGAFETDLATRGHPRAFVRYADMMTNWRAALGTAADQLGITFDADLSARDHHPVDDFIDTKLHRARVTWDDIDTIPQLQELAQTAWDALNDLVADPENPESLRAMDEARPRYTALHDYAEAIALDHTNCEVAKERRRVRTDVQTQVRRLRRQLRRSRRRLAQLREETPGGSAGASGGKWRQLASAAGARVRRLR